MILGTGQFARWLAVGLEGAHLPGLGVEGAFDGGYFRPCPLRPAIEEGDPGPMGRVVATSIGGRAGRLHKGPGGALGGPTPEGTPEGPIT